MNEMKFSGEEWIGDIPTHWDLTPIGSVFKQRNEKVSDKEFEPLSVTMQGILPQLETAAKTDDGDNRKLVKKGDFAINSRSDRRGSCGISPYDGSVSLINTILKPRGEMNPNFYNWLFHTSPFADEFYKWGHGIVDDLWTTRWQEMKNIFVVNPSMNDQQLIADYLDKKCGEIDSLISLQEQMIEKLKAYKQSVITEAVTKGLDPNAKLIPSGIDWIGDIPEGWKVSRLKYFSSFINGFAFSSDSFTMDNGCKVIRIGDISQSLDFSGCVRATISTTTLQPYRINNNDIVIAMSGATTGKCCIANEVEEAYINQRVGIIRSKSYFHIFYQLQTDYFLEYIKLNNMGSAQPNVSSTSISNFPLLVPPLSEQHAIASYLDSKCSDIDRLIALKQQKIESLKDYKKSVIYEAVTGKTIID